MIKRYHNKFNVFHVPELLYSHRLVVSGKLSWNICIQVHFSFGIQMIIQLFFGQPIVQVLKHLKMRSMTLCLPRSNRI